MVVMSRVLTLKVDMLTQHIRLEASGLPNVHVGLFTY